MSRIRANKFVNSSATGAPQLTFGAEVPVGYGITGAGGINIAGVATAASFVGNVTGNASGTAGGLTGTPDIAVRNITGVAATFTGVLTYEDVTNIDSVGIVTARTGIKVLAGGINAVGVVTATSFSGDGSNLSGVESGVANFVASGAIANGQTVVIKTDGTVGIVTLTPSASPAAGTPLVFDGNYSAGAGAYDSVNGKVVFAYADSGNGSYATAIVGTVSGTSITFGTPVVFQASNTNSYGVAYDSANEKIVIAYVQISDYHGRAIVGTVSGTSISFGSAVKFQSSAIAQVAAAYDSTAEKVVIAYRNVSNHGAAVVGTVSGTSISFGSIVVFEAAQTGKISLVHDSTNNKMVIAYRDEGNSNVGTAIVGTVSGTSISFGTAVVFLSASISGISATFDSNSNKVVIVYGDNGNNTYGTAIVGTVSGTSISFGSQVVFESASVDVLSAVYDSINQKILIVYPDVGNSTYPTAIVGTVSGTSISFGTPVVLQSTAQYVFSAAYDVTNRKAVFAYGNGASTATAVVFGATSEIPNLTSENYIGIAAEAIANTATGKINILGGVNTGQTGLTTAQTYFVQTNGTLSTSAGDPSVVAGTSISNTKILIR